MKNRLRRKLIEPETTHQINFTLTPIIVLDKDANNLAFDRTAAHLISKAQLLANDMDRQGDVLKITAVSDVQGGTASITIAGDILFTPDANYKGVMGFKYSIADAANDWEWRIAR